MKVQVAILSARSSPLLIGKLLTYAALDDFEIEVGDMVLVDVAGEQRRARVKQIGSNYQGYMKQVIEVLSRGRDEHISVTLSRRDWEDVLAHCRVVESGMYAMDRLAREARRALDR